MFKVVHRGFGEEGRVVFLTGGWDIGNRVVDRHELASLVPIAQDRNESNSENRMIGVKI